MRHYILSCTFPYCLRLHHRRLAKFLVMTSHTSRLFRLWPLPVFVLVGMVAAWLLNELALRLGTLFGFLLVLAVFGLPAVVVLLLSQLGESTGALRRAFKQLHWWHWLWVLAWASGFVLRQRGVNEIRDSPADAAATYRIALVAVVALVLAVRLGLRRSLWLRSLFQGLVGVLAIYGILCATTAVWSVYPALTAYKSLEYLTDIALLSAILSAIRSTTRYKTFLDWTWMLYGLLLGSVWIGLLLQPRLAWEAGYYTGALGHRLVGIFPEQDYNRVGDIGAILAVVALSRLLGAYKGRFSRNWYLAVFLASTAALILSQTRSAIVGFALGCVLVLLFSQRTRLTSRLLFVVVPTLLLSGAGNLVWSFLTRGQAQQQLTALSGRVAWWTAAWHLFLQRPFTGWGAYAAGRFVVLAALGNSRTGTLHSDYVEILVGNGILGLIPLTVALVGTWWLLLRFVRKFPPTSMERQIATESIGVLSVLSVRSVFMTILVLHPPLHFLAVLGCAEFLRRRTKHVVANETRARALRLVSSPVELVK